MLFLLILAACLSPYVCAAPRRSLHWHVDWSLLLQGDPGDALQEYGRWCGSPKCGMLDCCGGQPCAACVNDAAQLARTASEDCLAECPPVDDVDRLCMLHDFCVSAQIHRYNGSFGNCTYVVGQVKVPANECSCDQALYHGVRLLGGGPGDGFKGNLLSWLTSSWGHCLKTDAEHNMGACVPFRTAVSPGVYSSSGERLHGLTTFSRSPGQRASAALGAATGMLLPLLAWLYFTGGIHCCGSHRHHHSTKAIAQP
jgi:hypothetical protein